MVQNLEAAALVVAMRKALRVPGNTWENVGLVSFTVSNIHEFAAKLVLAGVTAPPIESSCEPPNA